MEEAMSRKVKASVNVGENQVPGGWGNEEAEARDLGWKELHLEQVRQTGAPQLRQTPEGPPLRF